MLVKRSNFEAILQRLEQPGNYGLDTETTGLAPYKGDRLFSIIIAQRTNVFGPIEESWYFNFNHYEGIDDDSVLDETHKEALQARVFSRCDHTWDLHNAKFDLHMLGVDGLSLAGTIYCTYANARLLHNDLRFYNLDFLAKRWLGKEKSDLVKEYADEHGLYEDVVKGKRKKKNYQFWRVPLNVIQEYAEKDGTLTCELGDFLRTKIAWLDADHRKATQPPLAQVSANECALTKVLFKMERLGLQLDKDYAERALEAERRNYQAAGATFKELTGFEYADGPTTITKAFKILGLELPKGASGRSLTNKVVLTGIKHPVVDAITAFRKSYKKATTYYANFLAMCDQEGIIHADLHQGGTKTGRLSCRDPNLQNLNRPDEAIDDEDGVFEVRRCFVPRNDFCFFAPDYDQIEYRLMLDYAQETSLIELVLGGMDVHSATAQMLGVTRFRAKTINFMLIYGGGIAKLATTLGISWAEAKEVYKLYFARLPNITSLVNDVREIAGKTLAIHNWFGRRYTFENADMVHTTAPNWLIQGGCADILKIALIRCDKFLEGYKSRIVLNIHDEIVFELHKSEFDLAPELVKIMESIYPSKSLPLTAAPAYSWKSLADKLDGFPC